MIEEIVRKHVPGATIELVKTTPSAVTTAWGVRWNEMQIARDLLQNFYDANREALEAITVTPNGRDVLIAGPVPFDVERLFYLGSEKTSDDVGQYGEGFKAAAMCLSRDHGVSPIGISGSSLTHVRLANEPVPGTRLHALIYDFYRITPPYSGTLLLLPGCSPVLVRELRQGMTHFFHDGNALIGAKVWDSWDRQYALYRSTTPEGHVFYRRLKRATIPDIPVVLVIHKANARIDKKVKQDRDRNAFEDAVLALCYDAFARQAADATEAVVAILQASERQWERGHSLIGSVARHRSSSAKETAAVFGDRYYAASPHGDLAAQLRRESIEATWKSEGRRMLPSYFTAFGVPSAHTHLAEIHTKALAEEKQKARTVTNAEKRGQDVLLGALANLAPSLATLFREKQVHYSIADTEAILGAIKNGRGYRSIHICLAASLFVDDFARAMAVFLHEHAHIFGYDGSRGFTDALTQLLEATIRGRASVNAYEAEWERARAAVLSERKTSAARVEPAADRLRGLDRDALLSLCQRVPEAILLPLIDDIRSER